MMKCQTRWDWRQCATENSWLNKQRERIPKARQPAAKQSWPIRPRKRADLLCTKVSAVGLWSHNFPLTTREIARAMTDHRRSSKWLTSASPGILLAVPSEIDTMHSLIRNNTSSTIHGILSTNSTELPHTPTPAKKKKKKKRKLSGVLHQGRPK